LKNDWETQHAAHLLNEHMSKSINRDSFKSVSQSDSQNSMKWRSCDLITVSRHHKSLWLNDMWQNDACSAN